MNKWKIIYTIIFIGLNIGMALAGTIAFLEHEIFYAHVPQLFLFILGFLVWITVVSPYVMSIIKDEWEVDNDR